MEFTLFSRKKRVVNMVITDHSIRYLELKQMNPLIPLRWGERLLPTGIIVNGKINDYETLINILEECVTDWKLKNRQVRFLIPESFVIIRKVSIPAEVNDDEIKAYLYLELGSSIHLPFDEPVFDAVVLSKGEEKQEILIFAAQEENVQEYTALFTEVKLEPVAAEVSPLAIYRLYHHLQKEHKNEDMLVVQFGLNDVNICIFENTVPFFMHHLPIEFNGEQWDKKLNRNGEYELVFIGETSQLSFQLDDAYKEINRLMDFYRYSLHQGKKQVSKILLSGDHPLLAQIKGELERRLEAPLETIELEQLEEELPHTFYLALGLALKGV
ncbi:pilus assembly protein PilM [Robertmurraya massiliosenegalensis]|uniref:type IV pilus biogenesis protein PilM n=1 Tax=Robertmurraya TaxID=2837507 RepID=UPI0039A4DE43